MGQTQTTPAILPLFYVCVWEIQIFVFMHVNFLEKEMAVHSSILTWRILWTEEPGLLQSMGSKRAEHDWATITLSGAENILELSQPLFWKYLDYDIIGIQRIYNKLYTLIYWACVCIQAVVTIKRVNKSIRPKYSHSPTCLSTAHSFQRNSNSQSTSSHCILVCTFQKYMQKKLCYT